MKQTPQVFAKEKPRWYQLRWKLSNLFVKIGRWVYPENPEVKAFWIQTTMDAMIYGESIVRVNPMDIRVNPMDIKKDKS